MQTFGCAACAIVLLIADAVSASPPPPGFSLEVCCCGATNIVVTDLAGRVLECWRGELKPGEVLRLGYERRAISDVLEWEHARLRSVLTENPWYQPQAFPELRTEPICEALSSLKQPSSFNRGDGTEQRFVLFLKKETAPLSLWLPSSPDFHDKHDFAVCTAWVENGRVVAIHSSGSWMPTYVAPIADSLEEFKVDVLARPAPLRDLKPAWQKPKSASPDATAGKLPIGG